MKNMLDILFIIGIALIIIGFLTTFLVSIRGVGESSGGFIILIGPIPIVGSWGTYGGFLTIILLLITLIILISIILYGRIFIRRSE
ncbi:MAG: hypothetical protein DRJ34_01880 [Thermoprotei archaeon]|nr:MAG: hypothetical protein DRJ34_01880 [Thermoprotei archaeon]